MARDVAAVILGRVLMKHRFAVIAALAAGTFGGLAVSPSSVPVALAPLAYAKACSPGYTHAVLGWGHKCLRAGQFCKVKNRFVSRAAIRTASTVTATA